MKSNVILSLVFCSTLTTLGCWVGYDTESVPLKTDAVDATGSNDATSTNDATDTLDVNGGDSDTCETCGTASCVDLDTDSGNCGVCAMRCSGECLGGRCDCGGASPVPLYSDSHHCGSCTNDCTTAQGATDQSFCATGVCVYHCDSGLGDCRTERGCETDYLQDERNCGTCDNNCPQNQECLDGQCG